MFSSTPKSAGPSEVFCYDEEKVQRTKHWLPETEPLVPLFKALADPTRLKIAYALAKERELWSAIWPMSWMLPLRPPLITFV